ncbi:Phosphoadenylyl-sulfate reductase [thioredoxin] [hydrothermal vent metagenome]|uniref:Phosphoadenylyl-sulfate reductase [thioredoxin] n=1 Tax=hydrothermal vent metagenome TaxID=652676 RepID=A0A3B0UJQ6_9ZZZZ
MSRLEVLKPELADPRSRPVNRPLDIVALNGMFDEYDGVGILRAAAKELLAGDLAVVSSFGADSAVLLHMVAEVDPNLPVLFLETGKHFAETLSYVQTLKQHFNLTNVQMIKPDAADIKRFDPRGELWKTDPDSCCYIRKTAPLEAALSQYGGWVTGRKRFQTSQRGVLPHFELTADERIKINPLAYWSNSDIIAYKKLHDLPAHPLFDLGYSSIGCAPCTSAVGDGEDVRAGRWRGKNKAECGIHFDVNKNIAAHLESREENLYKNGKFIADPWQNWREGDIAAKAHYRHVPLEVFASMRDQFMASAHPLGLLVLPGDDVTKIAGDIERFASIAIEFAAFTDGRGYSSARLLTQRLGYKGEVRAIGDILFDQIEFMARCGINAFVITNAATRKALEHKTPRTISIYMQPVGRDEPRAGVRPFLRWPVNENNEE